MSVFLFKSLHTAPPAVAGDIEGLQSVVLFAVRYRVVWLHILVQYVDAAVQDKIKWFSPKCLGNS